MGEYVTSAYTRVRGHGLGLFADSKPHILEDVQIELRPGMTFVVHPNTYNPNVGYMMLGDSVDRDRNGLRGLHDDAARALRRAPPNAPRIDRVVEDRTAGSGVRHAHRRDAHRDGRGEHRYAGRLHELHAARRRSRGCARSSRTGPSARWSCRSPARCRWFRPFRRAANRGSNRRPTARTCCSAPKIGPETARVLKEALPSGATIGVVELDASSGRRRPGAESRSARSSSTRPTRSSRRARPATPPVRRWRRSPPASRTKRWRRSMRTRPMRRPWSPRST